MNFNDNQCVLIENEDQFKLVHPYMRSAKSGVSFEKKMYQMGESPFPFYVENSHSVTRGSSIGIIYSPIGTWSRKQLQVLNIDDII